MKIPKDGKICQKGWIKPSALHEYYQQIYVYTIYPDKVALIEHANGNTQYIEATDIVWNCCCASRALLQQGCQCGGA